MRLHRELGIGQQAAWFMLQRLRLAYETDTSPFVGPVEIDETYMGGKRKNMTKAKRKQLSGRGSVGRVTVIGDKNRETNQMTARTVESTGRETLHDFVEGTTTPGTKVYTDDATAYCSMKSDHESVNHSTGEYVRDMAHTNGIESFWAMLKRGHQGTLHKINSKHMDRYIAELAGRHNARKRTPQIRWRAS